MTSQATGDPIQLQPKTGTPGAAVAILALCCVFWGFSFPAMKIAMDAFERQVLSNAGSAGSPLLMELAACATLNTWRFGGAAVLYWLLTRSRQRGFRRSDTLGGGLVGLFFAAGMFAQIVGLRYTLPSVSSFLTALVVVFAPLAQAFLFRKRVDPRTWAAVGLAMAGMIILSQPNPSATPENAAAPVPPFPYAGEILTVLGSLLFTGQILSIDHFGRQADTLRLTLVMFVTTALVSGLLGLCFGAHQFYAPALLTRLAADATLQWTMGLMIFFSSVLAMHFMNAYQPLITPAMAGVVYCLEPIFGTLFSILFATEVLTLATILGGAVILLAVLVVTRRSEKDAPQAVNPEPGLQAELGEGGGGT